MATPASTEGSAEKSSITSGHEAVSVTPTPAGDAFETLDGFGMQWHIVPGLDHTVVNMLAPDLLPSTGGNRLKTTCRAASMGASALVVVKTTGDRTNPSGDEKGRESFQSEIRARLGGVASLLTALVATASTQDEAMLNFLTDITKPRKK